MTLAVGPGRAQDCLKGGGEGTTTRIGHAVEAAPATAWKGLGRTEGRESIVLRFEAMQCLTDGAEADAVSGTESEPELELGGLGRLGMGAELEQDEQFGSAESAEVGLSRDHMSDQVTDIRRRGCDPISDSITHIG